MPEPIAEFRVTPEKARERTAALKLALRARYATPEWLLFEEISLDGLGRADGVAINCYQSSGFEIHGFELKASRSDWLRELSRMGKSANAFDLCNRWWLVSPPDVALKEELPVGWGWLQLNASGQLRKARQAPHHVSQPLGMRQLVNLLTRKHPRYVESPEEARLAARREYERGVADGKKNVGYEVSRDREKLDALEAFEKRTGLTLYSSTVDRLADAVLYVRNRGEEEIKRSVQTTRRQAERFLEETRWAE